ncbi:hypothetical protein B4113_3828 [Geobacillus sp. B4113_201601]|nr:hypothetical protein B4113_3828 [Geobacillus sp. B4113_201601]
MLKADDQSDRPRPERLARNEALASIPPSAIKQANPSWQPLDAPASTMPAVT